MVIVKLLMDTMAAGRSPRPPWRRWARWSIATCMLRLLGRDGQPTSFGFVKLLSRPAEFTMISASDFADLLMHIENAFV